MRRLVGISLACLVTSACTIANRPQQSTSQHLGEAASLPHGNGESWGVAYAGSAAGQGFGLVERQFASVERATNECGGIPAGTPLFGKAAWYNFVGKRTASGEILDTVTATAAHRSLPLASYAKVTNRDNGRSVIVKINDRGPYTRGRILDVSPRAADALDMKRAGVATVAIEPLDDRAYRSTAVFQTSGSAMLQ